jgi:hypothetical protein
MRTFALSLFRVFAVKLRRCFDGNPRPMMPRRKIERAYRELNAAAIFQERVIDKLPAEVQAAIRSGSGHTHMAAMAIALGAILEADANYTLIFQRMLRLAERINFAAKWNEN